MQSKPQGSLRIMCARVFWMLLGPLLLFLLAYGIVTIGTSWITSADIAFFVVLGIVLLCRWIESLGGNPLTAFGEPATPRQLRRYMVGTVVVGLSVWVIANILGVHLLER